MGGDLIYQMNVAIYIRVSTEEQNPENQIKDCESINKYGEYELLKDKQSAWKDYKEREEFETLKRKIKEKKLLHLIVWDLDRIYRNRLKLIDFLRFCKVYGCNVHSFRQKWLEEIYNIPSPWNEIVSDMLINVMGWMAEDESTKKSERVRLAVRKGNGETKSYKGNKWGKPPINNNVIEEVLKLYKEGISIRKIAEEVYYWDKNKNKHQISKSAVHKIIKEFNSKKFVKTEVPILNNIKTEN